MATNGRLVYGVWCVVYVRLSSYLADGECGTPLLLQYVQTNAPVRVDVAVVNARCEGNLRGEWYVWG